MNPKHYFICCATAVFLGLLFAYLFRFSITGGGERFGFKLDRWTGEVLVMVGNEQYFMKAPEHLK
jgi:hypothetical protein